MKTITTSLVALLVACTGAINVQAATGNVLLGQSMFEARCELNGGALDQINGDVACDLGSVLISCEFAGAYADCYWSGGQMNRQVVRLIGHVTAESITEPSSGEGSCYLWSPCNPKWYTLD